MAESAHERATRVAYDTVAEDYADLLRDELAGLPVERAVLAAFAELVADDGGGPVADLGCGPGRVTAHLDALGLSAFGIDLSPTMIEVARRSHPDLRFETGSMTALDLADGELAGILAWYSIIHTPTDDRPQLLAELARVLRPDGHLLLAFQIGDEHAHLDRAYGHDLSLDVYRLSPDTITDQLADAGLTVTVRVTREPIGPERQRQAFLIARGR